MEDICRQQDSQAEFCKSIRQELKNVMALSSNTYGLVKGRIQRKDRLTEAHNLQREEQAQVVNRHRQPQMAQPADVAQPADMARAADRPLIDVVDGHVLIPVRHDDIGPDEVHDPIDIAQT